MISKLSENKVLTSTAEITLDADGVFHIHIFPDIFVEKPDVQESLMAMKSIAKKPTDNLLLVDASEIKGLSLDGKEFSKGPEMGEFVLAQAGVVGNQISRVIGNFYNMFKPAPFEFALFTDEVSAKRWLLKVREEGVGGSRRTTNILQF